ncbi:MAG: PQQ-binding-like beta-propeller repeat protein [bacterium]|nr:PQQ-binding-like beta-propeller repeat protein [bacterium]
MWKSGFRIWVAVCVLLVATGPSFAEDWEQWRGPNGDGISSETDWDPSVLNGTQKVLWRANVGLGHSAVAVRDGKLYTMGSRQVQNRGADAWEDVVRCLDARTGREIWRYSYPSSDQDWPGPGSTPVLHGPYLYTLSRDGDLHCIRADNGTVAWRRNLVNDGLAQVPDWGFCTSALVVDRKLILNAGESGIALRPETGKVIWKSESKAGGLATPVLMKEGDTDVVLISSQRDLYSVEVATGKVRWSEPWGTYADPVLAGDRILLTSGGDGDKNGSKLFQMSSGRPEMVWHNERTNYSFQSWVALDGHGYGIARGRQGAFLECVDLADGQVKWAEKIGDWGGLAAAAGKLILIKDRGELVVVAASPQAYETISSAKIIDLQHWRTYPDSRPNTYWTAPVLSEGRIYTRTTHGDLLCVDVSG